MSEATRARIEELLRERPYASLRAIAREAGTTHNTVSSIRRRRGLDDYGLASPADEHLAYDDRRNRPPAVVRATLSVRGTDREMQASCDFSTSVIGTEEGLQAVVKKTAQKFYSTVLIAWLEAQATQS